MVSVYKSKKTTFHSAFANNSVFNLHFMKVSMEIDNNFGYEKITQLVDNIPLKYKGKQIKNLILVEKNFFTFCLLLLTFIFIKCKLKKKN